MTVVVEFCFKLCNIWYILFFVNGLDNCSTSECVNLLSAFWVELRRANLSPGFQLVEHDERLFLRLGGFPHFGDTIKDLSLYWEIVLRCCVFICNNMFQLCVLLCPLEDLYKLKLVCLVKYVVVLCCNW